MTKTDRQDQDGKFIEQNNSLMANGRTKPEEKTSFATFIYNKREGTFLGRNAKSWTQICVFYLIFYSILAAFWLMCLYIFLQTIDYDLPRYYGPNTIIGANPGVGYQPWLKDDPESTLIKFNMNDGSSYSHYVDAMDSYLAKYKNINKTRVCETSQTNADFIKNGKILNKDAQACRFNLSVFTDSDCGPGNSYGFKDGKPCVILSLNRLIGWVPEAFPENVPIPKEIKARYKKGSIAFSCDGISDSDKELIGHVRYIPSEGIDGRFYPFAVMENYHQPIAMVKFPGLPKNRLVMVECRAYAKNIEHDEENRIGMVTFELLLQDSDAKPS